jgi:DNA-binding transcriptional ArsR family regulator
MSQNDQILDAVFTALANDKRRAMVFDLSLTPSTIGELAVRYKLTLPAMHKHIGVLEAAQLIRRKKSGRTNFVTLDPTALKALQAWIMQYNTAWSNVDATLSNYITKMQE